MSIATGTVAFRASCRPKTAPLNPPPTTATRSAPGGARPFESCIDATPATATVAVCVSYMNTRPTGKGYRLHQLTVGNAAALADRLCHFKQETAAIPPFSSLLYCNTLAQHLLCNTPH